MKKRNEVLKRLMQLFLYFLLLSTGMLLSACRNNEVSSEMEQEIEIEQEISRDQNRIGEKQEIIESVEEISLESAQMKIAEARPFNEGLAWVRTSSSQENNGMSAWVAINTEGVAQFLSPVPEASPIPLPVANFSNGYSHFSARDSFICEVAIFCEHHIMSLARYRNHYVINNQGEVTHAIAVDDAPVIAFGDGFVMTKVVEEDFAGRTEIFTIFAPDGSKIESLEVNPMDFEYGFFARARYSGNGIFSLNKGERGTVYLYNTATNQWIYTGQSNLLDFRGGDTDVVVDSWEGVIYLIRTNGEIRQISKPDGHGIGHHTRVHYNNGTILMYNSFTGATSIFTYDVEQGIFHQPDEMWSELAAPGQTVRIASLAFTEDRIILPIYGIDNKFYVVIFCRDWNIIGEPIETRRTSTGEENTSFSPFSEGRLLVFTVESEVSGFDLNGNKVFHIPEQITGTIIERITGYRDGILLIDTTFYDLDGNKLFDVVDVSQIL